MHVARVVGVVGMARAVLPRTPALAFSTSATVSAAARPAGAYMLTSAEEARFGP